MYNVVTLCHKYMYRLFVECSHKYMYRLFVECILQTHMRIKATVTLDF